jgi:hypothetical protein
MIYGEISFSAYDIIAVFLKRKIFIYLLIAQMHVFSNNRQIVFSGFWDQAVFSGN